MSARPEHVPDEEGVILIHRTVVLTGPAHLPDNREHLIFVPAHVPDSSEDVSTASGDLLTSPGHVSGHPKHVPDEPGLLSLHPKHVTGGPEDVLTGPRDVIVHLTVLLLLPGLLKNALKQLLGCGVDHSRSSRVLQRSSVVYPGHFQHLSAVSECKFRKQKKHFCQSGLKCPEMTHFA